ncbi:hypothetical protein NADE_003751 [Nannochloris sp. 'desiccata']|nr:hypothetical protein NADE_003751 [Chlorella desiccata (nom. nud.)]
MPGKRLDVRAASSSVPWRNAQPTTPSTAPTEAEVAVEPSSATNSSSTPTTIQQPKIKDLVGYTAVLSIKAVNKQEDRVLGIVKEVIGASESGLGHPLLKVVSQAPITNIFTATTNTGTPTSDCNTALVPTTTTDTSLPLFQVEHLIPLVRKIVPRIDPGTKRLLVDPPAGLLDLGKRRAVLQHLKIELTQFITRQSSTKGRSTSEGARSNEESSLNDQYSAVENSGDNGVRSIFRGILNMPLRRELEASGRKDLVKLIQSIGGFIEVAQDLGFRPVRRPPGYWEDEEALDRELSLFVAANWVRFEEDSDTEELESAVFSDPQQSIDALQEEEEEEEISAEISDKDGNEDEKEINNERFFSQFQQQQQQRQPQEEEKLRAKTGNEVYWYNQVTRKVRWSAPVLPQTLALDDQGSTLLTDSPEDRAMPSRSALCAAGRYDLHQAIVAAGGYAQVSEDLDRYPAWPPSRHLRSFRTLAAELRDFVEETGLPKDRMPTRGELLSMGRSDVHQAITKLGGYSTVARKLRLKSQRKKRGEWRNIEATAVEVRKFAEGKIGKERDHNGFTAGGGGGGSACLRMPTHEELRAAGRHDLRHALQQHGSAEVARVAGLEVTRKTGLGNGKQRQRRLKEIIDAVRQNDEAATTEGVVLGKEN